MNTDDMDTSKIDPRIKLLSYSSLLTLHSCPRKFELYKLKATQDEIDPMAEINQNVTFAFGHVIGDGIQQVLAGLSEEQVLYKMFIDWHADLFDKNEKQVKSFWDAVVAIQKFIHLRQSGFLEEYELLYYKGKPATELSFSISFPDGFKMRGFVDAVLKHKHTGEIIVLECKTDSGSTMNSIKYKNSAQGVGYSVVLDVIAPEISSYKVLYLVYMSKHANYEIAQFPKTYLQRASWIQELLLDIESIKMYEQTKVYPMRGESCTNWNRPCEYLYQCSSDNAHVTIPFSGTLEDDNKVYDVQLTLMDLIQAQLDKNSTDIIGDSL